MSPPPRFPKAPTHDPHVLKPFAFIFGTLRGTVVINKIQKDSVEEMRFRCVLEVVLEPHFWGARPDPWGRGSHRPGPPRRSSVALVVVELGSWVPTVEKKRNYPDATHQDGCTSGFPGSKWAIFCVFRGGEDPPAPPTPARFPVTKVVWESGRGR